jgi:hypothetical protein
MGTDPDENASEVEAYVDNLGLEQNLEGQLKDVNDALAKMETGEPMECARPPVKKLPLNRLEAYPGRADCSLKYFAMKPQKMLSQYSFCGLFFCSVCRAVASLVCDSSASCEYLCAIPVDLLE